MIEKCIFCDNLKRKIEGDRQRYNVDTFLFDTENFIIALDAHPIHQIHILIIPRDHYTSFSLLPIDYFHEFDGIVRILQFLIKVKNFILFEHGGDEDCGQSIEHAHLHFIGNMDIDKELLIEKIAKSLLGVKSDEIHKNISNFDQLSNLRNLCAPYLFCYWGEESLILTQDDLKVKIPSQFFRSIFYDLPLGKFDWKMKENDQNEIKNILLESKVFFEDRVLIYSLVDFFCELKVKLVRDKIPQICSGGEGKGFEQREGGRFMFFLKKKLIEEVGEVIETIDQSDEEHLVEELGDVWEVLDAVMDFYKIPKERVLIHKNEKKLFRGGFENKIIMLKK